MASSGYNPFGSGSGSKGYSPFPRYKSSKGSGGALTAQQLLALMEAHKQKHSESFWDRVKHGGGSGLHGLSWTFDKLLRPEMAVATAIDQGVRYHHVGLGEMAHGAREGFMGRGDRGFGQVLEHHGVLPGHRRLRGLAGFGLDVAADPLTYLSLGTTAEAKTGFKAAQAAGRRAIEDRAMEITAKEGDINLLKQAGKPFQYRHGLASEQLRLAGKQSAGEAITHADFARHNLALSAAHAEERAVSRTVPHIRFAGRRISPDLPFSYPKLDNWIIKGRPGHSIAEKFREAFVRAGGDTAETHALRITARHVAEQRHGELLHGMMEIMDRVPRLSKDDQLKALHYFEKPVGDMKAVLKTSRGRFRLNEGYIKHLRSQGLLNEDQLKFVRAWHKATSVLYDSDKQFGLRYALEGAHVGEEGKLYVPHTIESGGNPLSDAQKSLLTEQGFERSRGRRSMSVLQLAEAGKDRLGYQVETDPFKLLAGRARKSGTRQAEMGLLHVMMENVGTPSRIVDRKALEAHLDNRDNVVAMLDHHNNAHTNSLAAAEELDRLGLDNAHVIARAEMHHQEASNLRKELQYLDERQKRIEVGRKNREAGMNLKTVAGAKDEFGHSYKFQPELAHAIERVHKVVDGDDKAIQDFSHGWAKWLASWKLLVTSVNPGYRVRNTTSDVWAAYISGMPSAQIGHYGAKAARLMVKAKKGDPRSVAKIIEMYNQGVLSGLYQGDIQAIAKMIEYQGSKKSLIKRGRFGKLAIKITQDMNRNAENWMRIAHYQWLREAKGFSAADAAFRVKRAHFDYEDLTPFEQRRMKMIAPFYTWVRKNVPFQIKALIERPGKVAAFPKLVGESEYASGGDQGNILPSYIPNELGFQIPFGKHEYVIPQIGISDLAALESGEGLKQRSLGLLNPALKIPFELATGRSTFTGQDIAGDHPRNPITPLGARLLGMIPGADVGQTSRIGPGGKRLTGPGANPYAVYALQQLGPWANYGLIRRGGIKQAQQGSIPAADLSQLAGVSTQYIDPAEQQMFAQIALQNAVKKQVKGLRDTGAMPQPKVRKSKKQRRINRELARRAGRR